MQTERGLDKEYEKGVIMREPEASEILFRFLWNKSGARADVYHCAPVPPEKGFNFSGMLIQAWILFNKDSLPVGWSPLCVFILKVPPERGQAIIQSNNYWSGLEFAPNPANAWNFNFNNGNQNANNKNNNFFALAVRPGE